MGANSGHFGAEMTERVETCGGRGGRGGLVRSRGCGGLAADLWRTMIEDESETEESKAGVLE